MKISPFSAISKNSLQRCLCSLLLAWCYVHHVLLCTDLFLLSFRRSAPTLVVRGICGRYSPAYPPRTTMNQQQRSFHTSFNKAKFREILDNKLFYITDMNNNALKYGLFGVAIGNPSTWVVSLITWMNSLGLPWWGAIGAGMIRFCFLV